MAKRPIQAWDRDYVVLVQRLRDLDAELKALVNQAQVLKAEVQPDAAASLAHEVAVDKAGKLIRNANMARANLRQVTGIPPTPAPSSLK